MTTELGSTSRRILGVLVEKELTTPNQYPLTVNSLTNGCNQKSNRHPVMSLDQYEVEDRLRLLQKEGWVASVEQDGARALKWSHRVPDRLGLGRPEMAVLTELLLRGAQQPGELRTRVNRMQRMASQQALDDALRGLVDKGFVRNAGRRPGERADRFDHTFYPEDEAPPEPAARSSASAAPEAGGLGARVDALEEEVADLRARLERLEDELT